MWCSATPGRKDVSREAELKVCPLGLAGASLLAIDFCLRLPCQFYQRFSGSIERLSRTLCETEAYNAFQACHRSLLPKLAELQYDHLIKIYPEGILILGLFFYRIQQFQELKAYLFCIRGRLPDLAFGRVLGAYI